MSPANPISKDHSAAQQQARDRNFNAMKEAITARDPEAQVRLDPSDSRVVMETILSEAEVLLILQSLVQDVEYVGKRSSKEEGSCGGQCCGGCS